MSRTTHSSEADQIQPAGRLGCVQVGLRILSILLVIYLLHALVLIVPNTVNRVKWHYRGTASYTFTIVRYGFFPDDLVMGRIVTVTNNRVTSVVSARSAGVAHQDDIEPISGMFNRVLGCSLLFLLVSFSAEYDPVYGYPSSVSVSCPIPDACSDHTVLSDFKPRPGD